MFDIFKKLFGTSRPSYYYPFSVGGFIPPDFGKQDYLDAYASIGWWHAVVFRIALGLSEVNWTLFDVKKRDKPKQIYEHAILDFLHLANPFQTSEEFIALDTIYMECLGESFWVLNYNKNGEPGEAVLAYPHYMKVVPAKQFPFVEGYVYDNGSKKVPLDPKEVIHFKYPNPSNQFRGLGQARTIGLNLSAEKNADKWVDQFFYNSARPDGVIQFDYTLSDEQFDRLKKQWAESYKGVNKAHQVALLQEGGKYVQIQNTVKDMDFPNLKLKNRDIILGVEGMPLSVMGISENVNKANAEAGDYTFARWIVKPRLNWKRAKLQEQLIPRFKNSKNLKLAFEEVVPQTAEQKRLDAESGIRGGYLTVNEARTQTGKDPLPGDVGDVLLLPLNLIPTSISREMPSTPPEEPHPEPHEEPKESPEAIPLKGYTQEWKREIWERFAQKTLRQEEAFKRVFSKFWNDQKADIVREFEAKQTIPDYLNDEKVAEQFESIIELVYADGFDSAIKQFDVLDEHALEWISSRSLGLAKSVNATTLPALRRELAIGFEQGESVQQLTKRIGGYYNTNEKWRAERVVRTEVIAANNEGALHGYEQVGVQRAIFLASADACDECSSLDGKEYPVADAHGIIPVHPNCTCTWLSALSPEAPPPSKPTAPRKPTRPRQPSARGPSGDEWKKVLSGDEAGAMRGWTMDGFTPMREYQRTGMGTPRIRKYTKAFEKGLRKDGSYSGEVYRGLGNLDTKTFNLISKSKTITLDATSSSSISPRMAANFARGSKTNPNRIVFQIKSKTGVDFRTFNPGEQEILLHKNSSYKVISQSRETMQALGSDKVDVLKMILEEI